MCIPIWDWPRFRTMISGGLVHVSQQAEAVREADDPEEKDQQCVRPPPTVFDRVQSHSFCDVVCSIHPMRVGAAAPRRAGTRRTTCQADPRQNSSATTWMPLLSVRIEAEIATRAARATPP